MAEITKHRSV